MTDSLKIKKILLFSELVELEEEEFLSLDRKYEIEFLTDFSREMSYDLAVKKNKTTPQIEASVPAELRIEKKDLKRLYRKLVRVTHPDLTNENDENFKLVQKAYDEGDGSVLMREAVRHGIEIEIPDKVYDDISKSLDSRKKIIEDKKSCARWIWCLSDKNDKLRKRIRAMMGIDQKKFEAWLKE
tara:strand:- start:1853 stop:2407 length:555 start_codon:yes stop_codon:yes gene_type:complete